MVSSPFPDLTAFSDTQWQLGMVNGALFGVPIPAKYEAIGVTLQQAVEQAVIEAEENGISKQGKEVTPWLLSRVGQLTSGKSLASSSCCPFADFCALTIDPDIALIENTALVGTDTVASLSLLNIYSDRRWADSCTILQFDARTPCKRQTFFAKHQNIDQSLAGLSY
jgi:hypothetical protein